LECSDNRLAAAEIPIADLSRRAYAASITAMDEEIGRVVAALDMPPALPGAEASFNEEA
jgi:hypothetical protein